MTTFVLHIDIAGEDTLTGFGIAQILADTSSRISQEFGHMQVEELMDSVNKLRDANGNTVGGWTVTNEV